MHRLTPSLRLALPAVAILTALALTGCAETQVATPAAPSAAVPSTDPAGSELVPPICDDVRAADGLDLPVETVPDAGLPSGATAIWLCGEASFPYGGRLGPREPLTTDVDSVISLINDLPKLPAEIACTAEYVLSYVFIVEYPDGKAVPLDGALHGCGVIGGTREGGGKVFEELTRRWAEQREAQPVPYTGDPDLCGNSYRQPYIGPDGFNSVLRVDGSDAVRGVVCGLPEDATSYSDPVVRRLLSDQFVADLAAAFAVPQDEDELGWGDALLPYFVLLNAHGDPVTVQVLPNGDVLAPGFPRPTMTDDLRGQVLKELDGLRMTRFAEIPPECESYWEDPVAVPSEITSGLVCIDRFAVPQAGPELPGELAAEIARRFEAEATAMDTYGFRDHFVLLRDDKGGSLKLDLAGEGAVLVEAESGRAWPIPADILTELTARGFDPER